LNKTFCSQQLVRRAEVDLFFLGPDAGKPDWKVLKNFLLKEGHLKKELVVMLARQSMEIMSKIICRVKLS